MSDIPLDKRPPDDVLNDYYVYLEWLSDYYENVATGKRADSSEKYDSMTFSFTKKKGLNVG